MKAAWQSRTLPEWLAEPSHYMTISKQPMGECSREFQLWSQKSQAAGDDATVFGVEGHANSFAEPWNVRRRALAEAGAKAKDGQRNVP